MIAITEEEFKIQYESNKLNEKRLWHRNQELQERTVEFAQNINNRLLLERKHFEFIVNSKVFT
jgi:hypothetical protein